MFHVIIRQVYQNRIAIATESVYFDSAQCDKFKERQLLNFGPVHVPFVACSSSPRPDCIVRGKH